MNRLREYSAYYLERLRQGDDEVGIFGLIDAGPEIVGFLVEAFEKEENCGIRTQIVHCIWQHRRRDEIGFLARLLRDSEKAVRLEALDGLVTIGGSARIDALNEAKAKLLVDQPRETSLVEWLDEALEQIRRQDAKSTTDTASAERDDQRD